MLSTVQVWLFGGSSSFLRLDAFFLLAVGAYDLTSLRIVWVVVGRKDVKLHTMERNEHVDLSIR